MSNYVIYHLHSDLSNGVTNIDSVTKYGQYIERAKECGMQAMGFAEHGSVFEWWHKKCDIEAAGMKYIHGSEVYITESIDYKMRDNMHCVLIARNLSGVYELNKLISKSFCRNDNHFYYAPRISIEELECTSNNIIVTTACIGGILNKSENEIRERIVKFLLRNKDRCFLEIGHHLDPQQVEYNRYLYQLSERYGFNLIAGTDTHALNNSHVKGRKILQLSKNIHFESEDSWDLTFKTYDELVNAYKVQNSLPEETYMTAIHNTNVLSDMIDPFSISKESKYPKIYDNPEAVFRDKIEKAIQTHPYALKNHSYDEIKAVVDKEFSVYMKVNAIDFMLMQTYLREWERENGIMCGYGRGSVSGSMIAYLLNITEMDSMRFDLNFFRFLNPDRVSNSDIDTDYGEEDRNKVKTFLLRDKMNIPKIQTSEIITFNTIAEKGAIRDVGRALNMNLQEVSYICNEVDKNGITEQLKSKYKELFEYVEIVTGTIVSIGSHPSGVLVADINIEELVGLCTTGTSNYQISMLNMKELDDLMIIKLDVLGLSNVSVINETCKLAGIDRLTPDNVDLNDITVWKEIRDDTTMIFQWESPAAQAYIRKFMSDTTLDKVRDKVKNFSMLKWMSFGNGLIRPACSSYRNEVASGKFYDNGFKELNEFLAQELGHVCMQETIMMFLVRFCGYSHAESDSVRRGIAKKKGTEMLLPEIENRFVEYSSSHYDITKEDCVEVIKPFLQVILDASAYGFSWNHSDAYSAIGYICGYLRHYYPYEFITASLNTFKDNEEKTKAITNYAFEHNIRIVPPKFGISKGNYFYNKHENVIAKGISSIKYLNMNVADELFDMANKFKYDYFMDLLLDMCVKTSINSRQLDILIKLNYFSDFGNVPTLLRINSMLEYLNSGTAKTIKKKKVEDETFIEMIKMYSTDTNAKGVVLKSYTITDMYGLLRCIEDYIKRLELTDFSLKMRCETQLELLGYIDLTTGKEEDKRKLMVTDIAPLISKESKTPWGYAVFTRSIGSGKTSRLTLKTNIYDKKPINKMDFIYAKSVSKRGEWWYLYDYSILSE